VKHYALVFPDVISHFILSSPITFTRKKRGIHCKKKTNKPKYPHSIPSELSVVSLFFYCVDQNPKVRPQLILSPQITFTRKKREITIVEKTYQNTLIFFQKPSSSPFLFFSNV
jgi:hypothetical protein